MNRWALRSLLFFLIFTNSNSRFHDFPLPENPHITYTYTRFPEVEKHCASILSSASELEPDDNRGDRLKKEFSFMDGEWEQEPGGAPLMPFDDREIETNYISYGAPLKLASMSIMDVDPIRRAKNAVSVSAIMEIAISKASLVPHDANRQVPDFLMAKGTTQLSILFEGVYVESMEKEGLRFLCLLGNATMPSLSQPTDSIKLKNFYILTSKQGTPSLLNDQILLVLRYPKSFTLTTRGITGEMKSLHQRWNDTYFDKVHIYALWGIYSKYMFGSEELLSKACSPSPCADYVLNGEEIFKGDGFCQILREFSFNEVFELRSAWKDFDKEGYLNKVGPFVLGRDLDVTYANVSKLKLKIQNLNCEAGVDKRGVLTAKVSAVLKMVSSSSEDRSIGLLGTTLSAEGIWHSSDGLLCMVGCLEVLGASSDRCNSRICLYFPLVMSIKQQNLVLGSIASINGKESHSSIIFHQAATPKTFLNRDRNYLRKLSWSYKYSKMVQAREFQQRSKPSTISTSLRKTFFQYPSAGGSTLEDFSILAQEFSFKSYAAPKSRPDSKVEIHISTHSTGSFFGRFYGRADPERSQAQKPFHSPRETVEISGHLNITGEQFHNISLLFEGLYNPIVGEMYLIGCRNVNNLQKSIAGGTNLEEGKDCEIAIKLMFSPKNARWLLNPRFRFSLQSKRSKKDPLYMSPINLDTSVFSTWLHPYKYEEMKNVEFRRGFEEVLRLTVLIFAVICILGQLKYAEKVGHPMTDISLTMLGVHALGFSFPLITRDNALFKWKEFASYETQNGISEEAQKFQTLDYCVKILLLLALLSTMKLLDKVWQSRKNHLDHSKRLKSRTPSDEIICIFTFLIHAIAFFISYALRKAYASQIFVQYTRANIQKLQIWWNEMANYAGLVQDFFLLPQIIGNVIWQVRSKPLRKLYYIGFTIIRLLINAYDYARDPVPDRHHSPDPGYDDEVFQYLGYKSYVRAGTITVSIAIFMLAMIVYIQQERSCQKCSGKKELEKCEELASKTDLYIRLLTD